MLQFLVKTIAPYMVSLLSRFLFAQTLEDAGKNLGRLALDPELHAKTKTYFAGPNEIKSSDLSYDVEKQEDLYVVSARLAGLSETELI